MYAMLLFTNFLQSTKRAPNCSARPPEHHFQRPTLFMLRLCAPAAVEGEEEGGVNARDGPGWKKEKEGKQGG